MGSFIDFSIPKGDRDLEDDELIEDSPVEIDESPSVLPEKEDAKNLVVKVIANNQEKGKRVSVEAMPIPRAFDSEYYQSKVDIANFHHDRDAAIKALAIKKYADIAYEFYRHIMYIFNKKNNILNQPEYIQTCEKVPCDIKTLADTMMLREQVLIRAFNGADNVNNAFAKRKHLTELKHFSAQAWMMYINLNNLNDFIGYLVYIQNCNDKADKTNVSHIANLYGLHIQTGYYLDANIKNFFNPQKNGLMSKKCPKSCYMYSDLNSMDQFNYLLKEKNAYVYSEHHEEIMGLKTKVAEDSMEKRIIGFYNHYRDMKYVKHKLRRIYNETKTEENVTDIFMFDDRYNPNEKYQNRSLYMVGYKYYKACKDLVETLPIKSKIYRDICEMCVELEETLLQNQDKFLICREENKKLEQDMKINHPDLVKQFEDENKKPKDETISSV